MSLNQRSVNGPNRLVGPMSSLEDIAGELVSLGEDACSGWS